MDDRPSSLPLTIKSRPGSVRDISDATTLQRKLRLASPDGLLATKISGRQQVLSQARRAGINYVTRVSAPVGWSLTIGYTLPAKTQVKSVRLNDSPAAFQIVPTNRGEEIHVQTNSGGTQEVRIQTE